MLMLLVMIENRWGRLNMIKTSESLCSNEDIVCHTQRRSQVTGLPFLHSGFTVHLKILGELH
jgi:hypothetical protein